VLIDVIRWVVQLKVDEGAVLDGLPGSVGRNLRGTLGGADATWDVESPVAPEPDIGGVVVVDAVALAPVSSGHVALTGSRVKRTVLFRVRPGTPAEVQKQLEADLVAMPRYISTIRSWALSRVDQATSPSPWTHVWEQEFGSIAGLSGEHTTNPHDWAGADRWFDQENPDAIVEPRLAQWLYQATGPVLQ
jgi:hypothetical protein